VAGRHVRAHAPGRVNLIGDHTDYAGGLALPMAIELGTTVTGERGGDRVRLRSSSQDEPADLPLHVDDPSSVSPAWARYVAGVVAEVEPRVGLAGTIDTSLPIGGGLSSSAALEVAVALALGTELEPLPLAELCQRAERRASGVPSGLMDQLTSVCGREGHALLIDFTTLEITHVPVPADAAVVVIDSGQPRTLAGSAYAERRADVERAVALVGPLRTAALGAVRGIDDMTARHRARHVVSENERVSEFADALSAGDLARAGELMTASHQSLRDDFEVSTPVLDQLVARLERTPGVFGARLTGAGFGGCVVALCEPGALEGEGWHLRAAAGASVEFTDTP
jgi:galactokinase